MSVETKAQVVEQITNKSGVETEKTLLSIFPETALHAKREVQTIVSQDVTRLSLNISNETLKDLERIKHLLSHTIPEGQLADVIEYISKDFLKRKDPLQKTLSSIHRADAPQNKAPVHPHVLPILKNTAAAKQRVNPKAIAAPTRRAIFQSAQARCSFKDSKTGRICNSTYQIEIDHIWPRSLGGDNDSSNLRCLCRKHNQLMSQKILGRHVAQQN